MAAVSRDELRRFCEGFPVGIFKGLNDAQLDKVGQVTSREKYDSGDLIIQDGDEGDTMFLLLDGTVRITKKLFIKSAKRIGEGEKEIIKLPSSFNPYFGELALFDPNSLRTATVSASDPSVCGVIQNKDFLDLANSDHDIGYLVLKNVLQKQVGVIRKSNENILNLTTALSFALSAR
ncbi:MAG: cyclic nucleotide-binding domain-containing protein [Candidatus Poribacteria bacterium]|nr:cyclic nucleotide-binding domain-containing protein [Candidatus Poribacteria bacterium]